MRIWLALLLLAGPASAQSYPDAFYSHPTKATSQQLSATEWNNSGEETEAIQAELGLNFKKVGLSNFLSNASVETWSAGASSAPDDWVLSGTGASVARQSDGQDGTYSAQITAGTAASKLEQSAPATISAIENARLRGIPFTLIAMVKTTGLSACRLEVNDGVGSTQSAYHTGGGSWERLSVTRSLDASTTTLKARLLNDKTDSATTCRFDSVVLREGKFAGEAFVRVVGDIATIWTCTADNCNALTAASGDTLDASAADSTAPCKDGTTPPATCAVSECFFDTDAAAGGNLFVCTSANTWTQISGGGGGSSKPFLAWTSNQSFLPTSAFATHDTRNTHPVLDFDASSDECAYVGGVLPSGYAGGGLTVGIVWLATSATTGATGWLTAFERHDDDVTDLDIDSFAANNSATATTASGSGETQYTTIAHTSGAQMDNLAAGESFRLRVCRDGDGSVVTDDMTGDAELLRVVVEEP